MSRYLERRWFALRQISAPATEERTTEASEEHGRRTLPLPLHCRLPVGTLRARRLRSTRPYEHSARNLAAAGYTGYEKLLLKPQDARVHAVEFKSGERRKLQDAGYVIVDSSATSGTSGATCSARRRALAPSSCRTPCTTSAS